MGVVSAPAGAPRRRCPPWPESGRSLGLDGRCGQLGRTRGCAHMSTLSAWLLCPIRFTCRIKCICRRWKDWRKGGRKALGTQPGRERDVAVRPAHWDRENFTERKSKAPLHTLGPTWALVVGGAVVMTWASVTCHGPELRAAHFSLRTDSSAVREGAGSILLPTRSPHFPAKKAPTFWWGDHSSQGFTFKAGCP